MSPSLRSGSPLLDRFPVTTDSIGSGGTGIVSGRGDGGPTRWKFTGSFRSPPDSVRFLPLSFSR